MIHIAGYEPGTNPPFLNDLLQKSSLIFIAERFRDSLAAFKEKLRPLVPLKGMFQEIRQAPSGADILVLTSGDPLFFGIGRTFLKEFPSDILKFYPGITTVQKACAHFKMPWDDMDFVSLHGKGSSNFGALVEKILKRNQYKVAVFTDSKNSPDVIAKKLLEDGLENARFLVAQDIGGPNEKYTSLLPEEAASETFHPLNLLIITGSHRRPNYRFGLCEDEFAHEQGLITKAEVRSVILSLLEVPQGNVFWDIGAGSGSVSIEASLLAPGLSIFAVEKDARRCQHLKVNKKRFMALNMKVVHDTAPRCLPALPQPDRIFIGGGLLTDGLLETCWDLLTDGGIMVASTILLESEHQLLAFTQKKGIRFHFTRVSSCRGKSLGSGHYLAPGPAITIWKLCK